jgi:hypothetical protein
MNWCRSKLILETEDSVNFQPIFEKWEEIHDKQSLLQAMLPILDGGNQLQEWGCMSQESHLDSAGFFEEATLDFIPEGTTKLTATFSTKLFNPYIGYRRLSYLLPGVLISLYDPDLSREHWLMSFNSGEIATRPPFDDFTVTHLRASDLLRNSQPAFQKVFPWMPTSKEEAGLDAYKTEYYYDLTEGCIKYI